MHGFEKKKARSTSPLTFQELRNANELRGYKRVFTSEAAAAFKKLRNANEFRGYERIFTSEAAAAFKKLRNANELKINLPLSPHDQNEETKHTRVLFPKKMLTLPLKKRGTTTNYKISDNKLITDEKPTINLHS